jgi:hypothetical protein
MSTIFFVEPDNANRKDALLDLLDSLQKLYPGQIRSEPAISVSTDVPEIEQLISRLIANQNTPASAPATKPPKARGPYRRAPKKTDPNGPGGPQGNQLDIHPAGDPLQDNVFSDIAEAEEKRTAPQSFTWRILKSGKECNSVSSLLKNRRLQPGDRLQHKERGLYEVAEKPGGRGLSLKRLAS